MSHIVCRRGYYSLEESFRDERGRPRKRTLIYYGKHDPRRDRMLATAERKAAEIDAFQRAEFGETGAERAARLAREAQFTPQEFLEETTNPSTSETPTPSSNLDSDSQSEAEQSGAEPDAEGSGGGG